MELIQSRKSRIHVNIGKYIFVEWCATVVIMVEKKLKKYKTAEREIMRWKGEFSLFRIFENHDDVIICQHFGPFTQNVNFLCNVSFHDKFLFKIELLKSKIQEQWNQSISSIFFSSKNERQNKRENKRVFLWSWYKVCCAGLKSKLIHLFEIC